MKCMLVYLICLFASLPSTRALGGAYSDFQKESLRRDARNEEQGRSYLIAGSLGLATSVGLGVNSRELLPKVGYTLMQALSSAVLVKGARLWYGDDERILAAARLRREAAILTRIPTLSRDARVALMDEATERELALLEARENTLRRAQGAVQLSVAAAAGATIAFSKAQDVSSNIILGFVALATTVGGVSDIFLLEGSSHYGENTISATFAPGEVGIAWKH